jgi:hypothetical protein
MSYKLKNDIYSKHRGSKSKLINLNCEHCGVQVAIYQKDGPGPLKYVYFDRIFSPNKLVGLENKKIDEVQNWDCFKCNSPLGIPFLFKKDAGKYAGEERLAFRIFESSIIKTICKNVGL